MIVRPPPEKPWEINQEQVTILKNTICKGATDIELQFCLTVARRYKLDPFRGQIWFVKRSDRTAEGGYRWIPIVGINGLLHIAARDHKDFGSFEEPEYGPMREIQWKYYEKSGKINAPEWARVTAWKKGHDHPVVATVWWDEVYPDVGAAPLVRQMPRLMLGKCARAQVCRQAYPATDGLYIKEEFQGRDEFTPGGRRIVYEEEPQQNGPDPAIENLRAKGLWCEQHQCAINTNHVRDCPNSAANLKTLAAGKKEEADPSNMPQGQQPEAAKEPTGAGKSTGGEKTAVAMDNPKPAPQGDVELDWTDKTSPIVRGDIANLTPMLEKHCMAKWDGAAPGWRIPPAKAETLREICSQLNFRLTERMPKSEPKSSPGKGQAMPSPPGGSATGGKGKSGASVMPSALPSVVSGIIEQANPQDKPPRVSVLLCTSEKPKVSVWMTTFDKPHFEPLMKAKGKSAEFFITTREKGDKTYTNIVGLKRVGNVTYAEDGKTPEIQNRDREAGQKTLY
jgi:hypothetical protein